jgi:hypothetical protein
LWELVEAGASDELAPSSNSHVRRRSLAGDIDAEMTELWTAAGHKFEPEKRLMRFVGGPVPDKHPDLAVQVLKEAFDKYKG